MDVEETEDLNFLKDKTSCGLFPINIRDSDKISFNKSLFPSNMIKDTFQESKSIWKVEDI